MPLLHHGMYWFNNNEVTSVQTSNKLTAEHCVCHQHSCTKLKYVYAKLTLYLNISSWCWLLLQLILVLWTPLSLLFLYILHCHLFTLLSSGKSSCTAMSSRTYVIWGATTERKCNFSSRRRLKLFDPSAPHRDRASLDLENCTRMYFHLVWPFNYGYFYNHVTFTVDVCKTSYFLAVSEMCLEHWVSETFKHWK